MAALFVVDDDLTSVNTTRELLRKLGNDVVIETNPLRALQMLESDREFDLTFLDVLMPDMTGEEIVRRLRTTAPARIRRICFLTGMAYLVETWLRSTGIPYIEKPANAETFKRMVDQFVRLDSSKGPRFDMPKKKTDADSTAKLQSILDADNDEESDEDDDDPEEITSVAIAKIKQDQARDVDNDAESFVTIVRYVRRKHNKVVRRLDEHDKRLDEMRAEIRKYLFAASAIISVVLGALEAWRTLRGH